MWNMTLTVIPRIEGALGTNRKSEELRMSKQEY